MNILAQTMFAVLTMTNLEGSAAFGYRYKSFPHGSCGMISQGKACEHVNIKEEVQL